MVKKKKQLTVTYELLQCRVFISVKLIKSLTGRYRQSKCTAFNRKGLCAHCINTGIHREKERITSRGDRREQTQDFRWSSNKNATVKSQGLKIAC